MTTSIFKGLVRFDPSLYGPGGTPMDATTMRDGIANGLLHIADSAGQVRVNYMAKKGEFLGLIPPAKEWYWWGYSTWRPFQGSPFGPWPLTLHQDGTGYILRVKLGVSSSPKEWITDPVTNLVKIVIAPVGDTSGYIWPGLSQDNEGQASWEVTSTSPQWRTIYSQGSDTAHALFISREQVARWIRDVSVWNGPNGTEPGTVKQVLVAAHVFGASSFVNPDLVILPRLHALHISEFCG